MLSSSSGASPSSANVSYSNERPSTSSIAGGDVEYASDPASGGFFHSDYKKHDDLKQMLDSNKDGLKLEAMKRIIGMIAKGRDASDLFPAVVKNVVSKNIEVKKLVYVYLVRYAEEQQDLALLSISTFQRALKDPNQLIRASALRVLSSIRVPMIVPIVMLAIKDSASDMSPYVRKTAAHAIPKLYSLDPEQKEELIVIIEKLLSERTTLVIGSAVMAFEEVCPERTDLIHKNYRKLCNLLVDVDEWGQVIIINMLTRYARTQFVDPNIDNNAEDDENKPFYDESSSDSDSGSKYKTEKAKNHKNNDTISNSNRTTYSLDPDHRLLLRNTKPLLQSRNASVVMGVAQMYHHIAPRSEVNIVAKALIRLLRSPREVQSVVLNCIASVSTLRKGMFEPYLKSFFVRTSDPTHIKLLKLEILTNLATETSISVILREFQTYISSNDKEFVAAAIQAIGRCAATIKEVTDTCLSGLVHLLSNKDEAVVAESVVVIKKLLQTQPSEHQEILVQMAKLMDFITVPAARASILWLMGEYSERVPKIAPDVLRKLTKSFVDEEDIVKLQVLNLAVKLFLNNPKQTELLCQYVLSLARYDQNYDIRDRARFLKQFIFPADGQNTKLSRFAHKIFLAPKPAPLLESKFKDREQFQLGSLSHYINSRALGYRDLPDYPAVAPDNTVRDVISPQDTTEYVPGDSPKPTATKKQSSKRRSFYSESEQSSGEDESQSGTGSSSSSDSDSNSEDSSSESGQEIENQKANKKANKIVKIINSEDNSGTEDSDSDSNSDSDSESSSSEESSENEDGDVKLEKSNTQSNKIQESSKEIEKTPAKSNLDLLLELDDLHMSTPIMTPSLGGFLTPITPNVVNPSTDSNMELVGPSYIPVKPQELLNKLTGQGLNITYRFLRSPHLYSHKMVSVELVFKNLGTQDITDIKVGQKFLSSGMSLNDFAPIDFLGVNITRPGILGIDFNDSTQPAIFEITTNAGTFKVTLKAPIGELVRSVMVSEKYFDGEQSKLRGMTEHSSNIDLSSEMLDHRCIAQKIFECMNVASIKTDSANVLKFAGQTLSSKSLVLITVRIDNNVAKVLVHCEKMVVGSMLLNEIKSVMQ